MPLLPTDVSENHVRHAQLHLCISGDNIYVNLFIGSEVRIPIDKNNSVRLKQLTSYPWHGAVSIQVNPDKAGTFSIKVRIPGWAQGTENPYGLYQSNLKAPVKLKVNQKDILLRIVDGYAEISREWKKAITSNLNYRCNLA